MDRIKFEINDKKVDDYELKSVKILINNIDLIEILRKYEMPFAKKEGHESIAGGYDGLAPEDLYKYLTNPDKYDKVSVLECECGCEGCWPMKVKVLNSKDKIIWTDFEQPHRNFKSHNFWDYSKFDKFVFEIDNYNEQLNKLKTY